MKQWVFRHISVVLFLSVSLLGVFVSPHIGVSWDEPDNIYASGVYVTFFRSSFDSSVLVNSSPSASYFGDRIYSQQTDLARYPPFPNYIGAAVALLAAKFGLGKSATVIIISFHIATGLFFGLLVATAHRFAKLLGFSRIVSLFCALVVFLYPTLFGYGYSNLKDTAQAAMFALSLYVLVKAFFEKPTLDSGNQSVKLYQYLTLGAVLWGLALATKFNAIYVPIIWFVWVVFRRGSREFSRRSSRISLLYTVYSLLFLLVVGIATAVSVWPYLWFDPWARGLEVIRYFTTVGQGYAVHWNGELFKVGTGRALWWYPWMHVIVNTPLPLVVLSVVGIATAVLQRKKYGLLLVWFVTPLLRVVFPNAAFYDGLRHFMEVLPALVLLSGLGFEQIASLWPKTATVVAVSVLAHLAFVNIHLFPYASAYTNMFVRQTSVRFDQDIEALSVREAIDWLHGTYGPVRLYAPIGRHLAWYVFTPFDHDAYRPEDANSIYIVNKASHWKQPGIGWDPAAPDTLYPGFTLVHTLERGGRIFGWILRRR